MSSPGSVAASRAGPPGSVAASRAGPSVDWPGRIRHAVFPVPDPRPLTARAVLLATGAVIAGTAICLARSTGHGPFDSMWAEDGNEFYNWVDMPCRRLR